MGNDFRTKSYNDGVLLNSMVPSNLSPEVVKILKTAETWEFNAFALDDATEGQPLSVLTYWLLESQGLIEEFCELLGTPCLFWLP